MKLSGARIEEAVITGLIVTGVTVMLYSIYRAWLLRDP